MGGTTYTSTYLEYGGLASERRGRSLTKGGVLLTVLANGSVGVATRDWVVCPMTEVSSFMYCQCRRLVTHTGALRIPVSVSR
jgi:hypothetical protein